MALTEERDGRNIFEVIADYMESKLRWDAESENQPTHKAPKERLARSQQLIFRSKNVI